MELLARKDALAYFLDLARRRIQHAQRQMANGVFLQDSVDRAAVEEFVQALAPKLTAWPYDESSDDVATQADEDGAIPSQRVNDRPSGKDLTQCLGAALQFTMTMACPPVVTTTAATTTEGMAAGRRAATTDRLVAFFQSFFGAQAGFIEDDAEVRLSDMHTRCG